MEKNELLWVSVHTSGVFLQEKTSPDYPCKSHEHVHRISHGLITIFTSFVLDSISPITTFCLHSLRYDFTNLSVVPLMPHLFPNRYCKIS